MKMKLISILALIFFTGNIYAGNRESRDTEESMIIRAKNKIEKTREGDWKSYADGAKMLLDQRINFEEVLVWLKKSIEIREASYNLALLGDYYLQQLDYKNAYQNYLRAIELAQIEHNPDVIPSIQVKVLITMGTQNYYRYKESELTK